MILMEIKKTMSDSIKKWHEMQEDKNWTADSTGNFIYKETQEMKEQTLVKMQYDLKLVQQALVVALNKIEAIERKLEIS